MSNSPGYLLRLTSGHLMLVWNRLCAEGQDSYPRRSGQLSEAEASWHREALSPAPSNDDGHTCSEATVVARGERLAYSYVSEPRTGELRVSAEGFRVRLQEKSLVP